MLQLITGGSGCGKTHYVREQLCELVRSGKSPVLIVPEQYSFESERVILSMLGAKDAHRVQVYSFTRLAEDIARRAGGSAGRRLDNCGRVAAMGLALSRLSGLLDYYKSKKSSNFIEHLLDAVKEFKLCAVTPAELNSAAARTDGRLRDKLTELALIYGAYDAITAQAAPADGDPLYGRLKDCGVYDKLPEQTLDPMDDLERLYEQLADIPFFSGKTVFIDSFRGFTGQELRVISRIMRQAELCAVTVCIERTGDRYEDENGLFASTLQTVGQLHDTAEKCGCGRLPDINLVKRHRFTSEPLEVIESSLFRRSENRSVCTETTDALTLYEAYDRYDELEFCARECRRLVREEGYRCRDIAIIARNEAAYAAIAADAFAQQGLPCFADLRVDAAGTPLMRFILSALEAARGGMRTADVMRCLKTGMIDGINPTDMAETENYCYIWNIPSGGWEQPFDQNPDGLGCRSTEETAARLERINAVRERVCSLLLPLRDALKKRKASNMATAVYRLMESSGAAQAMERMSRSMTPTAAAELPQLWELAVSILEQIHAIIGGETCSADEFISYITLMIKQADVGHIPHGLDEVTFGGADRMRVSSPRAVFVVGALDGEFPAIPGSAGVFTDDERRRLREDLGVQVAQNSDSKILEERLLVYNAFSAPSERLYLTWPATAGGSAAKRSECVDEALACVPNANQIKYTEQIPPERIGSADAAFELYARSLGKNDRLAASVGAVLREKDEWRSRVDAVDAARRGDSADAPKADGAQALFGKDIYLSASKADIYHQCRYRFFCQYGLNINPLRKAELNHMAYGTVAHYVLEHIFNQDVSFAELASDRQAMAEMVAALINRYLEEELGGRRGKTEGFLYHLRTMRHSLTSMALNLAKELSSSLFKPVEYEMKIGEKDADITPRPIDLPDGLRGHLTGSIDRVDEYIMDGKTYYRVIDYKTGTKKFQLSQLLDGLNMQMIIYLGELCADRSGSCPAGVLYCPAFSGFVEDARDTSDIRLDIKRDKNLKRNGIVVEPESGYPGDRPVEPADLPVSRAMEPGLHGYFVPITITNSKSEINSHSQKMLIKDSDFELVGRYVRHMLGCMIENVFRGNMSPDPIKSGDKSACEYCDYHAVCRYEESAREPLKLDNSDTLSRMASLLDDGGENK